MAVRSDGSYGVPEGHRFLVPGHHLAAATGRIVQGLEIDDFSRGRIDASRRGAAGGEGRRHPARADVPPRADPQTEPTDSGRTLEAWRATPLAGRGVGVAWRPPLDDWLLDRAGDQPHPLGFSEVVAENVSPATLPATITALVARGVAIVPHGVGLGLAGADLPDADGWPHLADLAVALDDTPGQRARRVRPCRRRPGTDELHADVLEAGHLVPAPRTREALEVWRRERPRRAGHPAGTPRALENVAATLAWPEDELDEPAFLTELVERTGCWVLLDVANLYATCQAHGGDPHALLARMPLERVAYGHVAGGAVQHGVYLDTHAHPVPPPVLDLVTDLLGERARPGRTAAAARAGRGRLRRHRGPQARRAPRPAARGGAVVSAPRVRGNDCAPGSPRCSARSSPVGARRLRRADDHRDGPGAAVQTPPGRRARGAVPGRRPVAGRAVRRVRAGAPAGGMRARRRRRLRRVGRRQGPGHRADPARLACPAGRAGRRRLAVVGRRCRRRLVVGVGAWVLRHRRGRSTWKD